MKEAEKRGVEIKYISIGPPPVKFELQVIHPEYEALGRVLAGRTIEIVADSKEAMTGSFRENDTDNSRVVWSKNKWLAIAHRDSIRHDFFHTFLFKLFELKEPLTEQEEKIYWKIKEDSWAQSEQEKDHRRRFPGDPVDGGEING